MKIKRWQERTKKGKIVVGTVTILLVTLVTTGGIFAWKVSHVFRNPVPIETRPSGQTGLSQSTLKPITGTPSDLDTDYTIDVPEPTRSPIYQAAAIDPDVLNILLIGYDARPGFETGNSDVLMVLSYNQREDTVKLVSLMRDLWVPIEGHGSDRINAAFPLGGEGLIINTVNDVFALDIQRYVTIRFEAFALVVDYLGGVPIDLTRSEVSYINKHVDNPKLAYQSGVQMLNGQQLLMHVRNRSVGNADFDRTRRQRETLIAIFKEIQEQNNPVALSRIITYSLDHVRTNLDPDMIYDIARQILDTPDLELSNSRVPFEGTWYYADQNGSSVIAIDTDANQEQMHQFLYEEVDG